MPTTNAANPRFSSLMKRLFGFLPLLAAAGAYTAIASTLSVNSSCLIGTCTNPDVVTGIVNTAIPFSTTYTFANTDQYSVSGNFIVQYNVPNSPFIARFDAPLNVTYVGNSTGTTSLSDLVTVDFKQSFGNFSPAVAGYYPTGAESDVSGTFVGNFGSGTQVQYQDHTNSFAEPVLGPFLASADPTFTQTLTGLPFTIVSPTTTLELTYMFDFGAGSAVGSSINAINEPSPISTTPEPPTWLLSGLGLPIAIWYRRVRAFASNSLSK